MLKFVDMPEKFRITFPVNLISEIFALRRVSEKKLRIFILRVHFHHGDGGTLQSSIKRFFVEINGHSRSQTDYFICLDNNGFPSSIK